MVDIKLLTDRARRTFLRLAQRVDDLKPVWAQFLEYWKTELIPAVWNSNGTMMEIDRQWTPLTVRYRKWKRGAGFGSQILFLTGKMKAAAMGGAGWFDKAEPKRLEFGIAGEEYYWWVSEREKNPRKYFFTRDYGLPARAWTKLITLTDKYLEEADNE